MYAALTGETEATSPLLLAWIFKPQKLEPGPFDQRKKHLRLLGNDVEVRCTKQNRGISKTSTFAPVAGGFPGVLNSASLCDVKRQQIQALLCFILICEFGKIEPCRLRSRKSRISTTVLSS